ncbi:helix-turn-helix domain-containing protein [Streptomyces sp. NPDC051572]|uniref:helix-turn-helix domain-containing protein n=1 Tax=Streptomyces sp. NPDC051572 TaxID=3155802 RepID=UPI00344C7441
MTWTSRHAGMGVAEIAARLGMQLTPTRRLLHELQVRGLVVCHVTGNADTDFLIRLKARLEAY